MKCWTRKATDEAQFHVLSLSAVSLQQGKPWGTFWTTACSMCGQTEVVEKETLWLETHRKGDWLFVCSDLPRSCFMDSCLFCIVSQGPRQCHPMSTKQTSHEMFMTLWSSLLNEFWNYFQITYEKLPLLSVSLVTVHWQLLYCTCLSAGSYKCCEGEKQEKLIFKQCLTVLTHPCSMLNMFLCEILWTHHSPCFQTSWALQSINCILSKGTTGPIVLEYVTRKHFEYG